MYLIKSLSGVCGQNAKMLISFGNECHAMQHMLLKYVGIMSNVNLKSTFAKHLIQL